MDIGCSPARVILSVIDLLQEHLPNISKVDIHDCDDDDVLIMVPIQMIGQMLGFKNLKKMALCIMNGFSDVENKYLISETTIQGKVNFQKIACIHSTYCSVWTLNENFYILSLSVFYYRSF